MITVRVYAEDITERLVDFDRLRIFRDTEPSGAFATTVVTTTLVAGRVLYSYDDTAGTGDSWYRYIFLNSSTLVESDPSPPFRPGGNTLARIAFLVAQAAGAAFSGVTTSNGSVTELIDAVLRDQGSDVSYLSSAWVRLPGAADADKVRRLAVEPFTPATGALAPVRAWSIGSASGDEYEVYSILPPKPQSGMTHSWADAVRAGLALVWFIDQIVVATGDGTAHAFALTAHPSLLDDNRRRGVYYRSTVDDVVYDRDASKGAGSWTVRPNGTAGKSLVMSRIPSTSEQIIMEVVRQPDTPWQDGDYIEIPEAIAVSAGVVAAFEYLNRVPSTKGQYATELVQAYAKFDRDYAPIKPGNTILQR
ncbi:MAG: hypothetical protein WC211_03630 [Dehalococcoidia bacterium]